MAIQENINCVVVGSGPAGAGAAHFFQPDRVYTTNQENAELSNEFWRYAYHPDNPAVWSDLVFQGNELLHFNQPPTETTGYLIQVKPDELPNVRRQVERISASASLPPDMKFNHPLIAIWESGHLAAARKGEHKFIHPSWQIAINTVGGKIPHGMDRLNRLIPDGSIRSGSRVTRIKNGDPGKIILKIETTQGQLEAQTEETIIAVGPFISGIDISEVNLDISRSAPKGMTLPEKVELPPGKIQVQSLINMEFSDDLIHWIAAITALRLTEPTERKDVLKSGIITEEELQEAGEDTDEIEKIVKGNLIVQLLQYGINGPLLQNLEKVYITRTNPTYETQTESKEKFEWEDFVRKGSWRKIMLGRESHEAGDMNEFPPSGKPDDSRTQIIEANNRRRENIVEGAKGLMPPVDALIGALKFIESDKAAELAGYNLKDLFIRHMPVQSGFYHVTTGIEIGVDNSSQYQELLTKYHEILDQADVGSRTDNTQRLERARIDPQMIVRNKSLCEYKYPFAVWRMDKTQKDTGKIIIPDVDLPYMDTVTINGALVSVIGWLRGRGFMAGPGAARILHEKHMQIKDNLFDPESEFGRYMQQFSILRMYQPELMDKILEEKILGGTGDI